MVYLRLNHTAVMLALVASRIRAVTLSDSPSEVLDGAARGRARTSLLRSEWPDNSRDGNEWPYNHKSSHNGPPDIIVNGHPWTSECVDLAGWMDIHGHGCSNYSSSCVSGAPTVDASYYYEKSSAANGDDVSALDACCRCGRQTAPQGFKLKYATNKSCNHTVPCGDATSESDAEAVTSTSNRQCSQNGWQRYLDQTLDTCAAMCEANACHYFVFFSAGAGKLAPCHTLTGECKEYNDPSCGNGGCKLYEHATRKPTKKSTIELVGEPTDANVTNLTKGPTNANATVMKAHAEAKAPSSKSGANLKHKARGGWLLSAVAVAAIVAPRQ